jgi:hypothetical protein
VCYQSRRVPRQAASPVPSSEHKGGTSNQHPWVHERNRYYEKDAANLSCGAKKADIYPEKVDLYHPRDITPRPPIYFVDFEGRLHIQRDNCQTSGINPERAANTLEILGLPRPRRRSRASVCYGSRRVSCQAARRAPKKRAGSEPDRAAPAPRCVMEVAGFPARRRRHAPKNARVQSAVPRPPAAPCLGVLRKLPGFLPGGAPCAKKTRGSRGRARPPRSRQPVDTAPRPRPRQ